MVLKVFSFIVLLMLACSCSSTKKNIPDSKTVPVSRSYSVPNPHYDHKIASSVRGLDWNRHKNLISYQLERAESARIEIKQEERVLDHTNTDGLITLKNFHKLLQDKRINFDQEISCFDDNESANYIDMSDIEISYYRIILLGKNFRDYRLKFVRYMGEIFFEKIMKMENTIRMKSRKCFKKIDGKLLYIVSERYN